MIQQQKQEYFVQRILSRCWRSLKIKTCSNGQHFLDHIQTFDILMGGVGWPPLVALCALFLKPCTAVT